MVETMETEINEEVKIKQFKKMETKTIACFNQLRIYLLLN